MGNRIIVPIGTTFGRLKIIQELKPHREPSGATARIFRCECFCGNEVAVRFHSLRTGSTTSCGCYRMAFMKTHGRYKTRSYRAWSHMKDRCLNPKDHAYLHYGGRGITVCERWLSFENFYEDMGDPPIGLTLERTDNSKGYSPENCRWATQEEQMNNRRCNHVVEHGGRKQTLAQWSRELGIPYGTLFSRVHNGHLLE